MPGIKQTCWKNRANKGGALYDSSYISRAKAITKKVKKLLAKHFADCDGNSTLRTGCKLRSGIAKWALFQQGVGID